MSQYNNKIRSSFFLYIFLGYLPLFATVNNTIYNIKKEALKLKINHEAVGMLNYLIEEYEKYHSLLFIQEYASECNTVVKEIKNEYLGDQYKKVVSAFFKEMFRLNIVFLQHKYAQVIFSIQKAISYWSYQYAHPWVYMFHKNPLKWFDKQIVTDEIHEHLIALEKVLKEYTIKLGRLIIHGNLVLSNTIDNSLEYIGKAAQEVRYLYALPTEENNPYTIKQISCVKALWALASAQNDVEYNLIKPIKKHMIPSHFERYWGHYILGINFGCFLYMQKGNPNSWLNNLIKEHHLVQHEQNFIKSFKNNFILPFKQMGNVLFGIPLDIENNYPERFTPLVQGYNNDVFERDRLAARGYDKLPDNFDLKLSIPYQFPEKDLKGYQLIWKFLISSPSYFIANRAEVSVPNVEWTEEQKEMFLQTNQLAGFALYQFLSAKADVLLTFLNMSHEIDLILKMIAIMPAIGLVYGSYKGIQSIYRFATSANYKPLHTVLVDMQECIIKVTVGLQGMDEDTYSYIVGKLFFLKYCAKKSASETLTKDGYKAFLKDLKKIQILPGDMNNGLQNIELIIKKYNINSIVS